jgi:hypothetical protein
MRSSAAAMLLAGLLAIVPTWALALEFTFDPDMWDLDDLDHYCAYTWGIDISHLAGMTICDVELRIDDITNFDSGPNVLWVHLLDDAPLGVRQLWDGHDSVDEFAGLGPLIDAWTDTNGPGVLNDLTYVMSTLGLLQTTREYAADGVLAFALDPDCHFWNNGVTVVVDVVGCSPVECTTWAKVKNLYR